MKLLAPSSRSRTSGILSSGLLLAALLAGTTMAASAPIDQADRVLREGTGARRDALTALELKKTTLPMDAMKEWIGTAVDAKAVEGKPVMLVFFSSWLPASAAVVSKADALAKQHAGNLVVIGVHDERRFDTLGKFMNERSLGFPVTRDVGGTIRKQFQVDADPDVYIIDRAGQLRFADIENAGIDAAVETVVKETAEIAAARPAAFAAELRDAEAAKGRTRVAGNAVTAGSQGRPQEVKFQLPDASQYEVAAWPTKNNSEGLSNDLQGQRAPFEIEPEMKWLTDQPKFAGRVTVVEFWATWCYPCKRAKPLLNEIQKAFRDDLNLVAVSSEDDAQKKPDVEKYLRENVSELYQLWDQSGKLKKAAQVNGIPAAFVVSTDGVVRWQGNPHEPGFRKAIEAIVAADPGVKARRLAEKRAINSTGG
jgi:thiol-disulfide isomerase/thioredoxin